jgi:dTDP-4-amino-4,6-dideoxygalactose transaminase
MSLELLATDGGLPVRTRPFAPWPVFDEAQCDAVQAVLKSGKVNYWTGQECRLFEKEFAAAVGCNHAIAVANGTLAIELALHALGIGPGDDVIVPPRTFIATASAVWARGARPIFADVDPISGNLTAETIAAALTPQTRAIIPVHIAGWPCDMDPILDLAHDRSLFVIEDCAQAHGASYRGRPVGSMGDIGAFSFCQDKIITTGGEGGMLTTNRKDVWGRAWSYKDHGKDWDAVYNREHPTIFKWTHESLGTNWRMTEMQAAIGRCALRELPDWVRSRRRNAAVLDQTLCRIPGLRTTVPADDFVHSYYKYYAFVELDQLQPGWDRDRIVKALQKEGIPCGSGICCEIYQETAFAAVGLQPATRCPNARRLSENSLMFLVHPTLSEPDMLDTARAVAKVMRHATSNNTQAMRRAA